MDTKASNTTSTQPVGGRFSGRRIHLIGIGGSGMRALAKMLVQMGASVSGSDMAASGATQRLIAQGVNVHIGQRSENLPDPCDIVVRSAAIHEQNPELAAATRRELNVLKYSQMLGELMAERVGVAIAGTHGKSTTTAMVSYVLQAAGADPSFVVGATVGQLGGPSGVGAGKHFVAEACEYDCSFLNLRPFYAAILNIDEDHLDCFPDLAAIIEAFRAFAAQVQPGGLLVANGEEREVAEAAASAACEVQTFGLTDGCTWQGVDLAEQRGCYEFGVRYGGEEFCRIRMSVPGQHSAYNALAATALLHHAGVERGQIAEHLGAFAGAHRRMTLKGQVHGITVVDDYAHHPTEIGVTLRAIRQHYRPRRLLCVFQPHQHSRTRFLLKDFAKSFGLADEVIVPDIYFVRDSDREKDYICSEDLVAQIRLHGGKAMYRNSFERIVSHLQETLEPGDLMVTMGAGNIWEVADEAVRRFREDR